MSATVIGIEDLLIDRLRAWVRWSSAEDGRWARRLAALHADRIDWSYLREKTDAIAEERDALAALATEVNSA